MAELPAAGQLVIDHERDGTAVVLALHGELDLASAPLLEHQLIEAEAGAPDRVVIDLSGLQFLDSSGVHALLRAHQRARENQRQLSLLRGPRVVHRMFELTSTAHTFSFDGRGDQGLEASLDGVRPPCRHRRRSTANRRLTASTITVQSPIQ